MCKCSNLGQNPDFEINHLLNAIIVGGERHLEFRVDSLPLPLHGAQLHQRRNEELRKALQALRKMAARRLKVEDRRLAVGVSVVVAAVLPVEHVEGVLVRILGRAHEDHVF